MLFFFSFLMRYSGDRMFLTTEWVNEWIFLFPNLGEWVCAFVRCLQYRFFRQKHRERTSRSRQSFYSGLAHCCLSKQVRLVLTRFLPRCWVISGRAKILKELKFVPSAQSWATDLSKYLVPGSNYCEDIKFLSISEACPSLSFKHSIMPMIKACCCKQM